jgi:hypothetical protein
MKQVEDDFDLGDFLLDGQERGIPHVCHNGFQRLPLFFVPAQKEPLKKKMIRALILSQLEEKVWLRPESSVK